MTEKLEREVDKDTVKMNYLERIDSRDKDIPRNVGNYDGHVPKLNPLMSLTCYRVFV